MYLIEEKINNIHLLWVQWKYNKLYYEKEYLNIQRNSYIWNWNNFI